MPRRKSSIKRKRADKKRQQRNLKIKHQLRKTLKKFRALISQKNVEQAKALLKEAYSRLDKAAKKRIIHPKTANRKKSRLALELFKQAQVNH